MEAEHATADIVAFYAVVKLTNGGKLLKVMRRSEVDEVRDRFAPRTKAGKLVGPWVTDYEPMGCKTVLIQALKLAPKDSERLVAALQAENDAIFGDRVAAGVVEARARRVRAGREPHRRAGARGAGRGHRGRGHRGAARRRLRARLRTRRRAARPRARRRRRRIRPPAATKAQLTQIARLQKSTGIYEAEFAAVLDSYGATDPAQLSEESAGYVIEALKERGAP